MKHFFLETLVASTPGVTLYLIGAFWLLGSFAG
jgi:hypothetical protein